MPELTIKKVIAWEVITQPRIWDDEGNTYTSEIRHQAVHVKHGEQELYFVGYPSGQEGGWTVETLVPWEFFWRYHLVPNPVPE